MAVPKRRVSSTRRDKRRTHDGAPAVTVATCPQCHKPVLPHTVCKSCGYYNGNKVMTTREEANEA
ncbi:MAG: 50S ribosomal protein L32 [Clostridia bacterium]|nr:50S ribosomal protein L32 [Clostridia bacterium]